MNVAIYSRKSVFTGKGDSIGNQIQLCKEYIGKNYIGEQIEYIVYEDEGFSGGNTNRPQFQALLKDAENKKFEILICYKLDRISRNVADFSTTLELLQKNSIDFISIKEQFDTSTPMGKAMLYIASVFAQLERETIAERVRDNMLGLAKSGRWLGGQTPLGFDSEKITYLDHEFKERTMVKLVPNEKELETVNLIFDKYYETKSIRKVQTFLLQHNIKTKMEKDWNIKGISGLISNPVYVKSNDEIFEYLEAKGINLAGTPNGNGILTYNKKKGRSVFRDTSEWIAAVGKHKGVIEPDKWLKIQQIKEKNKSKAPRLGKTNNVLLSGLVKCSQCNSPLAVIHSRIGKDGNKIFYYSCTLKQNSKGTRCNAKNIRADYIDKEVIKKLTLYNTRYKDTLIDILQKSIKKNIKENSSLQTAHENLVKEKTEIESKIKNLVNQLSENNSSSACKYIIKAIEDHEQKLKEIILKIDSLTEENSSNNENINSIELILNYLSNALIAFNNGDIDSFKTFLTAIIDSIIVDAENDTAEINFYKSKKK